MYRSYFAKVFKVRGTGADVLGVSEAIGSLLLLGISVTLAGAIALWTQTIDEGEEGLYVDLWSTVQQGNVVIMHRGGDLLEGSNTFVRIVNSDGSSAIYASYSDLTSPTDEYWGPGESLTINLTAVSDNFKVTITTVKANGNPTIVLNVDMVKSDASLVLPDLAITMVKVRDTNGVVMSSGIYEEGPYQIMVRVENFGSNLTTPYLVPNYAASSVSNLQLFDANDDLDITSLTVHHYTDPPGTEVFGADVGMLRTGDIMEVIYTWNAFEENPRTLGIHNLNVKVLPCSDGELNYRNNYVDRKIKVNKEIIPQIINGPDPGIYDIYFSDDAPHSGDTVTVTVIIQNSGDEPITLGSNVNLIVSTWAPMRMQGTNVEGGFEYVDSYYVKESYDWKMDTAPYYGQWRSRVTGVGGVVSPLVYDDDFPTCVVPDVVLLPGAYFFYYFTLEARVDVPGGEQWIYATIDVYDNPGMMQGISALSGDDTDDNQAFGNIQVLPRILLVDDDEVSTGSPGDMTSSVVEALIGAGVTIDKLFIAQSVKDDGDDRDTPAFDYVQSEVPAPAMEDYDIVIWVTGYAADPLTNKPVDGGNRFGGNIQEMMRFMDSNKYLFIIGGSPLEGLSDLFFDGDTAIPNPPYTLGSLAFTDGSEFVRDYLGITKIDNEVDMPLAGEVMRGLDTGEGGVTPIPSGETQYDIELNDLSAGNHLMQLFKIRGIGQEVAGKELPVGITTTQDDIDASTGKWSMVRSTSTPSGVHNAQFRVALMAWDLNQIEYLNEKINLFAGILRWFDWKISVGRDLAITRMQLFILTETTPGVWDETPITSTNLPKYLDTVYIEVTVRNNGPAVESTSIMFYVTGPDGIELPITSQLYDPRYVNTREPFGNPQDISGISGGGGEVVKYKLWLAIGVGEFTFRVIVDPYHLISEVSEENNDITYSTSTVTSFVTQNNILIVDDDFSANNFDTDPLTLSNMGALTIDYSAQGGSPADLMDQAVTELGYDHEVHIVENSYATGAWVLDSKLGILDLKRYNAVLWVMGDSGDRGLSQRETLTNLDIEALSKYLNGDYTEASFLPEDHNESVVFIGLNFLKDLSDFRAQVASGTMTVQMFADEYLGVDVGTSPDIHTGIAIGGPTDGNFIEDIYTGLVCSDGLQMSMFRYREIEMSSGKPSSTWDLREDLYAREAVTRSVHTVGSQLFRHEPAPDLKFFRTITQTWQVTRLYNTDINPDPDEVESPLHEFIYASLHWFDTPESRPELLSRNSKILFDNDNPVLGNSYLVEVEVANIGGVAGGGTVRFSDGNTLIKSENIYLEADKVTTLEAIWTPLYAGERSMRINIDFYDDYDEVFDILNNGPHQEREIYFFWDDLESGEANWEHDSVVQMLNGEGKLDYLEEPTTSDIVDTWAEMRGFNLNKDIENSLVEKEYHSSNVSFMMHEPNGEVRSPIDVTMVIDTSASMSGAKIQAARTAAKTFVDQMGEFDRVALYRFQNTEDVWRIQDLTYTTAANKVTIKALIDTFPASSYTPIWDTIGEATAYSYANRQAGRTPSVVALTDGDDYGTNGDETGSETFAPGSEPNVHSSAASWGRNDLTGLVWGDPLKSYNNQIGGTRDIIRYYGAYTNLNIESGGTVGQSRTGLIHAPVYIFTIGLGIDPRDSTYVNGASTPPSQSWSPFTTEYSLWEIAHTSSYNSVGNGKYYFAPTAAELQTIYDDIFSEIQDLAQQTTRAETRAGEVLYYKLDESWGSATVSDASGWGHTGTVTYTDDWTSPAIIAGGVNMDSDNTITVPSSVRLDNMNINTRSISFWMNADDTSTRQVIFRQGSSTNGMTIYLYSNRLYAGWASSTMGNNYLSIPFTDVNQWHFVAFVTDFAFGSEVLWLDGIPLATAASTGQVNVDVTGIRIGSSGGLSTRYHDTVSSLSWNYMNAFLDDLRVFNYRLGDLDVKALYEQALADINGLRAEYYYDTGIGGSFGPSTFQFTRIEGRVNYDWGSGGPSGATFTNRFTVRWSGYILPTYTETYTFYALTDDGARLWVNDVRIINSWVTQNGGTENTGAISLVANKLYPIVLEYFERDTNAKAILSWSSASLSKETIPAEKLFVSQYSTVSGGGGGGGGGGSTTVDPLNPWDDGSEVNDDKWLLTEPIDLRYIDHATLSFYHKYNLKIGANGGVIQIGTAESDMAPAGAYKYRYIQPDQPYTGNTLTSAWSTNLDDNGVPMRWAWNGKSAGGTMGWEYVSVNLDPYIGHFIRIKFLYVYNYGGSGFGWIIDDVMVKVSSDVDNENKAGTTDNWDLVTTTDKNGDDTHAWFAGNEKLDGDFLNGVDNSLYTRPIDLTNARSAYLYAEFKFNIQVASGRPPDGFRVEISTDNGISWVPLSLGVRTAWDVSGSESDASDGVAGDGKSFTGLPIGKYWVSSDSLTRLVTNLEGFIGNTVILRVRVVTNIDDQHYEDPLEFKGLYVDNFVVYGESLEGSRAGPLNAQTTAEADTAAGVAGQGLMDEAPAGRPAQEAPPASAPLSIASQDQGMALWMVLLLLGLALLMGVSVMLLARRS